MPRRPEPHPYRVSVTHYVGPDGRRCKKDTPGARKVLVRTERYYADLPGAPRTPLGTSDLAEAWKALRDKLKEQHERALGIRDAYTDHARTDIAAHVEEWAAMLKAKGTTETQVGLSRNRLLRLCELAGWKRLPQIDHDGAVKALALVQAPTDQGGLGKSAATRNHYLGHLKAFVGWCHDGGRLKSNPVRRIAPLNTEADRRRVRRIPTTEEVAELFRWLGTEAAPVRKGLSGAERRLGYQLAAASGFRAKELRALTPAGFDLAGGAVTCPASYTKRKRHDTQQLPPWLAEALRGWFAGGGGWGWSRLKKEEPGEFLKWDLEAARAAWIDAAGEGTEERARRETSDFLRYRIDTPQGTRWWDFHSFRHWYCTAVASLPGMDLKTLLSLTRHSTAELALKTYAKPLEERIRAAVDRLPPPEG